MKPSEHREFLAALERTSFPYEVWLGETGENIIYNSSKDYLAEISFSPIAAGDYEAFVRLFGKAEVGNFITLMAGKGDAAPVET
jgi:hypothetical protein